MSRFIFASSPQIFSHMPLTFQRVEGVSFLTGTAQAGLSMERLIDKLAVLERPGGPTVSPGRSSRSLWRMGPEVKDFVWYLRLTADSSPHLCW